MSCVSLSISENTLHNNVDYIGTVYSYIGTLYSAVCTSYYYTVYIYVGGEWSSARNSHIGLRPLLMLSETPCQKRPFPITAKKQLLMLSEKAFSDQIFLDKIFRQAHPVGKFYLKWFCTPRRRQTPSGSTQETVHAAHSNNTQQQQYWCWLTHTAAAQQQHRCWAGC